MHCLLQPIFNLVTKSAQCLTEEKKTNNNFYIVLQGTQHAPTFK